VTNLTLMPLLCSWAMRSGRWFRRAGGIRPARLRAASGLASPACPVGPVRASLSACTSERAKAGMTWVCSRAKAASICWRDSSGATSRRLTERAQVQVRRGKDKQCKIGERERTVPVGVGRQWHRVGAHKLGAEHATAKRGRDGVERRSGWVQGTSRSVRVSESVRISQNQSESVRISQNQSE
jgi:hypothetical protein